MYRDLNLLGVKGSCMSRNVSIARLQCLELQHVMILKRLEEDISSRGYKKQARKISSENVGCNQRWGRYQVKMWKHVPEECDHCWRSSPPSPSSWCCPRASCARCRGRPCRRRRLEELGRGRWILIICVIRSGGFCKLSRGKYSIFAKSLNSGTCLLSISNISLKERWQLKTRLALTTTRRLSPSNSLPATSKPCVTPEKYKIVFKLGHKKRW